MRAQNKAGIDLMRDMRKERKAEFRKPNRVKQAKIGGE